MLCYVHKPNLPEEAFKHPDNCLAHFKVQEIETKRWLPASERLSNEPSEKPDLPSLRE